MATTTIVPGSDGTTEWIPKGAGTHFSEVDEEIANTDEGSTELTSDASTAQNIDFLILETLPSNFDTATDFKLRIRSKQAGRVDDTVNVIISIVESNETTTVGLQNAHDIGSDTSYTTNELALQTNTDNKATWENGRRFKILAQKFASGMPDSVTIFVTALEALFNYNTTSLGRNRYYITSS